MRALALRVGFVAVAALGCAPAESNTGGAGGAAGTGFAGTGAGIGGAAGTGVAGIGGSNTGCLTFETQACMCNSVPGRRVCALGTWGDCKCEGPGGGSGSNAGDPAANKNANISWNWTPTMAAGGCRPGHYEGNFEGGYSSSLTFIGFPIPVSGVSFDATMPALEFNLDAAPGGGEILQVSGGKMRGTANGLFPFAFDIVGDLDCATLKFNAELTNGYYMVGTTMIPIGGPLTADYDPVTGSMVNGQWIVTEPGYSPPAFSTAPWYGGEGTWHAMYTGP